MLTLNFSPFPVLQTARLQLRQLSLKDIDELIYLRSDERIIKYIGRHPMVSKDQAIEFINLISENLEKKEGILWAINHKDSPKMIGTIGFWHFEKEHYRAEIGYQLGHEEWRKGIMKEAALKVIDYGFREMKLHTIAANINPANTASEALLESCGFEAEGYFKESFYFDGEFTDAKIFSLITNVGK